MYLWPQLEKVAPRCTWLHLRMTCIVSSNRLSQFRGAGGIAFRTLVETLKPGLTGQHAYPCVLPAPAATSLLRVVLMWQAAHVQLCRWNRDTTACTNVVAAGRPQRKNSFVTTSRLSSWLAHVLLLTRSKNTSGSATFLQSPGLYLELCAA